MSARGKKSLRYCAKCLSKHAAPTGRKCTREPPVLASGSQGSGSSQGSQNSDAFQVGITSALQEILTRIECLEVGSKKTRRRTRRVVEESSDAEYDDHDDDDDGDDDGSDPDESGSDYETADEDEESRKAKRKRRKEQKKKETKKSGILRVGGRNPRRPNKWPQEYIIRPGGHTPGWEEISAAELVLGLSRMASEALRDGREEEYEGIAGFQETILKDLDRFPFITVRTAVEAVLLEIENKELNWRDKRGVRFTRQQELAMAGVPVSKGFADPTAAIKVNERKEKQGTRYCVPYQRDECPIIAKAHGSEHGKVRHMCAWCFKHLRKHYVHHEKDCTKKPESEQGTIEN